MLKPGGNLISISGPPDPKFARDFGLGRMLELVMRLGDERLVRTEAAEQSRAVASDLEHQVHADRKVRAVNESDLFFVNDVAHLVDAVVPSGGANHHRPSCIRDPLDVIDHRCRLGKIDAHVGVFDVPARAGHGVNHAGDFDLPAAGRLFDHPPHLAITEQRYLHSRG